MHFDSELEQKMYNALQQEFRYDYDFVSQFPIRCKYGYVLDFAFPKEKIAVECDGERWHLKNNRHDQRRDKVLERRGWIILRFTGKEISNNISACVKEIKQEVNKRR